MIPAWWSWVLSGLGCVGIWLAGNKSRAGWWVGLATEGLWLAYAFLTNQLGFVLGAVAYGVVCVRNLIRWTPKNA